MKLRRLFLALLTVLLLCAAVSAADYSDVSDAYWANEQIVYLKDEITGYPDGTYRPEKTVSRAEFLTLFARIAYPDEWKQAESDEWWKAAYDICTNQGLLTGYPDGSFKPAKGVTRAEAAAILARLKAQLALREKGCEYVCTVGDYWLMQYGLADSVGLGLYEPLTGKAVKTVGLWGEAPSINGYVVTDRLLTGTDGMYVWGRAGLYKRSGSTLEQIVAEPVLDFCWYGDHTLYYLSWDDTRPMPSYTYAAMPEPAASKVMKQETSGQNTVTTVIAERDEKNFMQNLTDIYVENGTVYVAGSYCMGMMDAHAALYEVKDGTLTALFGEY